MTRTVLVTGGASGIGRATAERFRRAGDRVVTVDLKGGDITADVRDADAAKRAVAQAGPVDVLVACAGVTTDAEWDEVLDVDLKGVHNYIAACTGGFKERRGGKVVAVSSTLALRGRHGMAPFAAAKAGIIGLARSAARDLGEFNVNVNVVAPGLVKTSLAEKVPAEVQERLRRETCLGRLAEPDDVAAVICFLCSEDARHVTGEVVRVDGGQLA